MFPLNSYFIILIDKYNKHRQVIILIIIRNLFKQQSILNIFCLSNKRTPQRKMSDMLIHQTFNSVFGLFFSRFPIINDAYES